MPDALGEKDVEGVSSEIIRGPTHRPELVRPESRALGHSHALPRRASAGGGEPFAWKQQTIPTAFMEPAFLDSTRWFDEFGRHGAHIVGFVK